MAYGSPIKLRGSMFYPTPSVPTDGTASAIDGDLSFAQDSQTFYQRQNGTWTALGNSVKGAKGDMGISGLNAQLLHGQNPPTTSTFTNDSDAIYIQDGSGEVWYFDFEGAKTWTDSGTSFRGPTGATGATGAAGADGSKIYNGSGAPTGSTPGKSGDYYLDTNSGLLYLYS